MTDVNQTRLHAQIRRGEGLVDAARMVSEDGEHRYWKVRRDHWAAETAELVGTLAGERVVRSFERTLKRPPVDGGLFEELPLEVESLHNALAVLLGVATRGG